MKSSESTYALIVRSEEKSRGILELIVYACLILSAVFSIWQFAHQPVIVPAVGLSAATELKLASTDCGREVCS